MNKQEIEKAITHLNDRLRYCSGATAINKNVVELCISALTQQLNNGWIPVSPETNPKESDIYIATFEENGKRYVERFYYSSIVGWMMPVAWQDEGRIDNLIAWQPLPEPYKEVSE